MADDAPATIYQLHVSLQAISPAIWRRLLVRSDTTIADLHSTIQIAFGWTDSHLHRFVIYGKDYGVAQSGGIHFADDSTRVCLRDFRFRLNTWFRYEYDLDDCWQHQIRLEQILPCDPARTYPVCIGGARAAPPEDCGGPSAFLTLKQQYSPWFIADRLVTLLARDPHALDRDALQTFQYWLSVDRFDRRAVNRRLQAYRRGDDDWWRM
jgi:hypothetical protein